MEKGAVVRVTTAVVVVFGLCLAGCGGAEEDPTAATSAQPCAGVKPAKKRKTDYRAPRQIVTPGEDLTARVRTSCGEFSIALDTRTFPAATNSFVFLARKGFYDGTRFDEAGAGKYLHGGDPPGPAEGPGYGVSEEVPVAFIYRHRMVALTDGGNEAEGSVGSQFFIVVAKPWLDRGGDNMKVGVVSEGFDVVDRISRLGPGDPDEPSNLGVTGEVGPLRRPVAIESIAIESG
jgi:peptidyl-prolyl cis-trans isomerase B (cyclophilin B)